MGTAAVIGLPPDCKGDPRVPLLPGLTIALTLATVLVFPVFRSAEAWSAAAESVTVSGRVVDEGARGIPGVLLELSPALPRGDRQVAVTGADGSYSIKVTRGWTGRVRPKRSACAVYSPQSRSYMQVVADQPGQDYQAAYRTVVISGRVADPSGKGIPGVTIVGLSAFTGTSYVAVVTGTDGYYRHRVLCGFTHPEVKPAKPDYAFVPASRAYSGLAADLANQNYQAIRRSP